MPKLTAPEIRLQFKSEPPMMSCWLQIGAGEQPFLFGQAPLRLCEADPAAFKTFQDLMQLGLRQFLKETTGADVLGFNEVSPGAPSDQH